MYLRYSVLWHAHWLYVLMLVPLPVQAAELHLGARSEITHPGKGHEVHLSGPTVAIARDGGVLVGWIAPKEQVNHLYLARPTAQGHQAVRVNPDGLEVESFPFTRRRTAFRTSPAYQRGPPHVALL